MKFDKRNFRLGINVVLGENVRIGDRTVIYDNVVIGDNTTICNDCIIGEPISDYYTNNDYTNPKTVIGPDSLVRSHSIIYADSTFGAGLSTGHRVLIRENCKFGKFCSIGNGTELHGSCSGGDYVRIHSNADLAHLTMGSYVWIYTGTRFTNDPHPPSDILNGAYVGDFSIVAVNAVVLSGVKIGKHCLIGANSLVTRDISDFSLAVGNPAVVKCDIRDFRSSNSERSYYPWPYQFSRGMPWQDMGYENWMNEQK